jgi:hypothetical protein
LDRVDPWTLVDHDIASDSFEVTAFPAEIPDWMASFNELAIVEDQLPRSEVVMEMMDIDERKK